VDRCLRQWVSTRENILIVDMTTKLTSTVNTDDVVENDEDDEYDDDAYESFDSEGEPHELSVSSAHSDRSSLKRTSIPGYTSGRYAIPEIHDNDPDVECSPISPVSEEIQEGFRRFRQEQHQSVIFPPSGQ
jgi:hypothetical protein